MEGKSGILVVLIIIDVLLLVCAIVFGVFCALEMTDMLEDNLLNFYVSLGSGAMFILTSLGIIIARNARITADNTYDILRHVELLLKKEGVSLADLARRDKKVAEKIEAQTRKKKEKALRKQAEEVELEESVDEHEETSEAPAEKDSHTVVSAPLESAPVASEPEEPVLDTDVNLGIDLSAWREALEGKVACGLCGKPVLVKPTKRVAYILMCSDVPAKACSNKLMTVGEFAGKFIEWFSAFYGEKPARFSLDDFNAKVKSVTITNGECHFVSKDA